jgi:hypothetical protein
MIDVDELARSLCAAQRRTPAEPPAWRSLGACRGADPAIFFPERGDSTIEAKQVCAGCPVRGECLDFALDLNEKFGIWGGKSERERRRMRAPRRRGGSPPWSEERRRQVQTMHAQGAAVTDIARQLGVSARTVHRYVNPEEAAS